MTLSTKFADQGTRVSVLTFDEDRISSHLKPAVYAVDFNPMTGFYLTKRGEALDVPDKVYGSVARKQEKILASYADATKSFGVLLSGDKGSGKTMTSAIVANTTKARFDIPIILIESAHEPGGLIEFIEQIGECVLFIDEFGKKFDDDEGLQGALLGLFDGLSSKRRLVLLTENSTRDINRYMLNRPGRVHYHFRHEKLDESIIREYCADYDLQASVIEQICLRREASREFSFDVLQAIVTEYLRFGGDINEVCDDLNIERPYDYSDHLLEVIEIQDLSNQTPRQLRNKNAVDFPTSNSNSDIQLTSLTDPKDWDYAQVSIQQIVNKDGDVYTFALRTNEGHDLVLKARQKERTHAYGAY